MCHSSKEMYAIMHRLVKSSQFQIAHQIKQWFHRAKFPNIMPLKNIFTGKKGSDSSITMPQNTTTK